MSRARSPRESVGFTLIELLLVVALIGILAAIAVPSLLRARSTALEAATIGSLRTMNTALASYAATCGGGSFPPAAVWLTRPPTGKGGGRACSWVSNSLRTRPIARATGSASRRGRES